MKLHFQLKFETKLTTNNWIGVKIVILLKYIENTNKVRNTENKAQIDIKSYPVRGNPLFIDTMSKSSSLNENNMNTQDYARWQYLIDWNTSLVQITCCYIINQHHIIIFQFNKILSHRQSIPHHLVNAMSTKPTKILKLGFCPLCLF